MSAQVAAKPDALAPTFQASAYTPTPGASWSEEAARRLVAWLDAEPRPRLLATPDGEVTWMNRAARDLPRDAFPFAADGAASFGVRVDRRLLDTDGAAPGELRCATASVEFRGEPCMVWSRSLPGPAGPVLALTVKLRRERPNLEILAWARQLTRAEIRVLELMTVGVETAPLAETLGISVDTVRTHVKHAYRKLGVTSRGELFAAVADFLQP